METSKEGTKISLDPKIQELYARLEEEREKNNTLREENTRLIEQLRSGKINDRSSKSQDTQKVILNTKRKIALQEQLNEKKLQDEIITNQQSKIESLAESLDDTQEIQDIDSKSISELKSALDSLIEGREKRKSMIRKVSSKNRQLMEENDDLKFTRTKLAHDLRSLMSSILGTLSLADLGEAEAMETLIPMLKDRCHVFINLLSAINDGTIDKEIIKIQDVTKLLNLTVSDGQQNILVELTGENTPFLADKAGLYDVFQNLINNSVKYSGVEEENLVIKVCVNEDEKNTVIKIADNGQGISPENRMKIFDLYNRAGLTDKNGKGIGLYMVKKMIDKHDGAIHYDESYSDGAQFVITLPKA